MSQPDPRQGLEKGRAIRDAKIALVIIYKQFCTSRFEHAWLTFLMTYQRGSIDDIHLLVEVPDEIGRSAWGAATRALVSADLIAVVARVQSRRPLRHGAENKIFALIVEHRDVKKRLLTHPVPDEPERGDDGAAAPARPKPKPRPPGPDGNGSYKHIPV